MGGVPRTNGNGSDEEEDDDVLDDDEDEDDDDDSSIQILETSTRPPVAAKGRKKSSASDLNNNTLINKIANNTNGLNGESSSSKRPAPTQMNFVNSFSPSSAHSTTNPIATSIG